VLERFGFTWSLAQATPLATSHSLSAPPSDESVEPSGPYPELVGCLMYVMTCTQPDLAYTRSLLAHYVAPGRHEKVHWDAAKRVLHYLCSTAGMGLVLGGRGPVVLTGHADAPWVDDSATQQSSQGYTFSLGSGRVSWRSIRSSSVLSSICEAEIYAGAMAAQELRWLTYLLTDLGEQPRSPPVLYRGQLHLAYVATRANTVDVFTKALPPCDHQRLCTVLGLNGIAARANRTIGKAAKTMLGAAGMPYKFWPDVVHHVIMVKNRVLTHFVEDVMYKDWQQQQQVQSGFRLQEIEWSAVEEVQLHVDELHGSELTSDHSGGGEQQLFGPVRRKDWRMSRHGAMAVQADEGDDEQMAFCFFTPLRGEPATLEEALRGPQKEEWKAAMDAEFNSLIENGT
ncbi:unnamed protein product, partial [Closterium sp. NIES-53]